MNENEITSPEEAVAALLQRVPSFAAARSQDESYISHDDDGSYLVYGDFARFIMDRIVESSKVTEDKQDVLVESFKLLRELATSQDDEIANIAVVGAFEELADCPDCIIVAKEMLSKPALKAFKRVLPG